MDKILYMLNVILIGVVAGAYAVHWSLGLGSSLLIAAAICDNRPTQPNKG
ncbi:hypothetical protein Ah13B_10 [Aeromonas phage AhMtk13b]|nr:hypothetical protein Ah13B_10 [Aeromonas phage AhMtk13b]